MDLAADGRWSVRASYPDRNQDAVAVERKPQRSWEDDFVALLRQLEVELVFPVMHGAIGEDGRLQTLCASISIPYVGSDPESAIRCYDKVMFKRIVAAAGLPTANGLCVKQQDYEALLGEIVGSIERSVGYPCIVKPSRSGSSLGLARVELPDELPQALEQAFHYDDTALIEEFCPGSDVEIGVIGSVPPTVGDPIGIQCDEPLYDFAAKYARRDALEIPAALSDRVTAELMRSARTVFASTGCRGLARVDFLVDRENGRYVVNELNTIPYMTAESSFAESLKRVIGEPYEHLIARVADLAWIEHRARPKH